jgi:hypothetical protein
MFNAPCVLEGHKDLKRTQGADLSSNATKLPPGLSTRSTRPAFSAAIFCYFFYCLGKGTRALQTLS